MYIHIHTYVYMHTHIYAYICHSGDKNHTLIMYFVYNQIIFSLYIILVTINRRNERNKKTYSLINNKKNNGAFVPLGNENPCLAINDYWEN